MSEALESVVPTTTATVRDATFEVMRRLGMTRIFGNPGSTEVPFLTDLPDDIEFVMGLHEGAVVGMATGYALATGKPQFVNLHTAPGLGHAVNATANARDVHAPLVIVVGQQDRRQLHLSPFLSGRALEKLAGEYPVWTNFPTRAQDVPGAIARAFHEACSASGPALVVVPMGDWQEPPGPIPAGAPATLIEPAGVQPEQLHPLVALLAQAESPVIVTGAGTDTPAGFAATVALAERLFCPVWHEPFSARAGFPEDHPLFAGHLDWHRRLMRETLAPHDVVLVLGTKAFQLYILDEEQPPVTEGTRVAVVTADANEALQSACELAVVAPVAAVCDLLARLVPDRPGGDADSFRRPGPPEPPELGEPLQSAHVLAILAEELPPDAVLVEESPTCRPEILERIPTRAPLGFLSNGNGSLGIGFATAIGLRMALPDRPVVAIVGDGSALFGIQALWSAAHYSAGVLMIVMANGAYGVMDAQARARGGEPAWPQFPELDVAAIARGMGCPAIRIETFGELQETLPDALYGLRNATEPLLLEVVVTP
ncbi:MAG TPA: thiamine pyrophosphate-dependent enzyme [Solirubrobacteraceae bacterium]|nr:thiamine pyrophosphate-dependent enzyme [Solirubrobacteraceae bacterium]